MQTLNIFYEEPNPDRWFKYDRYIRDFIRRILRGKPKVSGQRMVAINLMKGLDELGIPYRFNDYHYAIKHPNGLIGVIGKPYLLKEKKFKNPILFGASVFSHPLDEPQLIEDFPNIKKILVPGEWMRNMFTSYYGQIVQSWPVGIDTNKWNISIKKPSEYDFLIYDKIRWNYDIMEKDLIRPIKQKLKELGLTYTSITYGKYMPEELIDKVSKVKSVIFLCEHETQGLAYQQILATNTPIFAYDQEEFWQDPQYFPYTIKYGPVSSVPYWDNRCGLKFNTIEDFKLKIHDFINMLTNDQFNPNQFILENLTLQKCAQDYYNIYDVLTKNNQ